MHQIKFRYRPTFLMLCVPLIPTITLYYLVESAKATFIMFDTWDEAGRGLGFLRDAYRLGCIHWGPNLLPFDCRCLETHTLAT